MASKYQITIIETGSEIEQNVINTEIRAQTSKNTPKTSKLRRRRSRKITIWEGAQGPDPVPNPTLGWGGPPQILAT